jgi:hypothetical protein
MQTHTRQQLARSSGTNRRQKRIKFCRQFVCLAPAGRSAKCELGPLFDFNQQMKWPPPSDARSHQSGSAAVPMMARVHHARLLGRSARAV